MSFFHPVRGQFYSSPRVGSWERSYAPKLRGSIRKKVAHLLSDQHASSGKHVDACDDRGAPLFFLILPLNLGALKTLSQNMSWRKI